MFDWLYTPSGGEGFVNQDYGPSGDRRIGGLVGALLAVVQRSLAFGTNRRPTAWVYRRDGWKVGVEWSWFYIVPLPWFMLFIPRPLVDRPRWRSFRAGWRFDPTWDGHPGTGVCFPDVILKSRIDNLVE